MKKWEYEPAWFRTFAELSDSLNGYGDQGWEMVSFVLEDSNNYICIFKREKINHEGNSSKKTQKGSGQTSNS